MDELVDEGNESRKTKDAAFFEQAERFRSSQDEIEIKRLGELLGRFIFGEFGE
jgi:hypothetical protein